MQVLDSLSAKLYARLHRRRTISFAVYLVELLVVYELVRCLSFAVRHSELIDGARLERCGPTAADEIPENLEVELTDGRVSVNVPGPVVIELPQCVQDSFGLAASYLSHGALEPHEVWYSVAPFVVILDRKSLRVDPLDAVEEAMAGAKTRAGKRRLTAMPYDFDAVFLVVGPRKARLLEIAPVGYIVKQAVRLGAKPDLHAQTAGKAAAARMDRASAKAGLQAFAKRLDEEPFLRVFVYTHLILLLLSTGFVIGLLSSLELLITSSILSAGVRKDRLTPSMRFWTIKRHLAAHGERGALTDEQLEAEQRTLQEWYFDPERGSVRRAEAFEAMAQLEFYFVGIAVHSATLALLVDAVYPVPIGNTISAGGIIHLISSALVVRYIALPGLLIDAFLAPRLVELHRQAANVAIDRAPARRANPGANPAPRALSRAEVAWASFVRDQRHIYATLRSPVLSFRAKTLTVAHRMRYIQRKFYSDPAPVHVVHVWSRLNDGPDPSGGPGWCYGLSTKSGAWVLICSYDHPCSLAGARALATFPGTIIVADRESDGDCPPSLLPTQGELDDLQTRLASLKAELARLRQAEADSAARATRRRAN